MGGLLGCRRGLEQIEEPVRTNIVGDLQHLWIITPELMFQAVGETNTLNLELFVPGDREAVTKAIELLGVDEYATKPRSSRASTIGPCGVSMATWMSLGLPPLACSNQAIMSVRPVPP
jgi:hypothetical protein